MTLSVQRTHEVYIEVLFCRIGRGHRSNAERYLDPERGAQIPENPDESGIPEAFTKELQWGRGA